MLAVLFKEELRGPLVGVQNLETDMSPQVLGCQEQFRD